MSYVSGPKSLAERLQWMADNLPGFREELNAVDALERSARERQAGSMHAENISEQVGLQDVAPVTNEVAR